MINKTLQNPECLKSWVLAVFEKGGGNISLRIYSILPSFIYSLIYLVNSFINIFKVLEI